MRPADVIRLRHMLEAAEHAVNFVAHRQRTDLERDPQLTLSLLKALEIMGEAANKVSAETQTTHPQVPWRDMVTMRNWLIHVYFDVNLDIVWNTIKDDLPPLIDQLRAILCETEG